MASPRRRTGSGSGIRAHANSSRADFNPRWVFVALKRLRDARGISLALMQDDSVAEPELLACVQLILTGSAQAEIMPSERIGGEQAVRPDVPGCGVAEAPWMVHDRDSHRFALHQPGVVDPGRCL